MEKLNNELFRYSNYFQKVLNLESELKELNSQDLKIPYQKPKAWLLIFVCLSILLLWMVLSAIIFGELVLRSKSEKCLIPLTYSYTLAHGKYITFKPLHDRNYEVIYLQSKGKCLVLPLEILDNGETIVVRH